MVNKYIGYLKKSVIFLVILLFVVSFSFGMTYSNFIYNSDSHRAVEMFTSKLDYTVKINDIETKNIELNPGNNNLSVSIKSNNNVDSFYKVVYEMNNVNVSFYNKNDDNIIKSEQTISLNIIVFNKTNNKIPFKIDVVGGFTTNNYEDVKTPYGYYEIENNVSDLDSITLDGIVYRILSIKEDGSYELLSNVVDSKSLIGAYGYNHIVTMLNNLNAPLNTLVYRSVNLSDLNKYLVNNPIDYSSSVYFENVYYPGIWKNEDSIINNVKNNNVMSREEEVTIDNDIENAESITMKNLDLSKIEFKDKKYEVLFTDSNYYIATRYNQASESAEWGVMSINDGELTLNKLYDSNNSSYEVNNNIRVYTIISNKENLFNKSI